MVKAWYRSYALTHRPLGGVTNVAVDEWHAYLNKRCIYWAMITEIKLDKAGNDIPGTRHLHMQLFFERQTAKCDLLKCVLCLKCMKSLTPIQKQVYKAGHRPGYNKNWERKYMSGSDVVQQGDSAKPDSRVDWRSSYLPDDYSILDEYYPAKNDSQLVGAPKRKKQTFFDIMEEHYHLEKAKPHSIFFRTRPQMNDMRALYNYLAFNQRVLPIIKTPKTLDDTLRLCIQYIVGPQQPLEHSNV